MAQKIARTLLFVTIAVSLFAFISNIKDSVMINLPRYPSYSCVIIAATLFGDNSNTGSLYRLGKIDWDQRAYVMDDASDIGMPFYYSWSSTMIRVPCGNKP